MTTTPFEQDPERWSELAGELEESAHFEIQTRYYGAEALRLTGAVPGTRVLDVGAGTGSLAIPAAQAGIDVLATDFAPGMVAYMREKARRLGLDNFRAEVMDGQNLTLDDESFDVVISVFCLILFADRAAGYREFRRVLVPGGRAAVVSYARPPRDAIRGIVVKAMKKAAPELSESSVLPFGAELADPARLKREMEAGGFRDVVVHGSEQTLTVPGPQWVWDHLRGLFPGLGDTVWSLEDSRRAAFRDELLDQLHRIYGDGPIAFDDAANIGVGVR